jgi:hypothetical protein
MLTMLRDTAERQSRAYVLVVDVAKIRTDPEEIAGPGLEVLVEFKNDGQTPAYDVFQWAKIDIREFPLAERLPIQCIDASTRAILPAGAKAMACPTFRYDLTPNEEQAIAESRAAIYVFGEVDYVDTFGKRHLTQFRFRCNGHDYALGNFKPDSDGYNVR